jgi:hypothetical protein
MDEQPEQEVNTYTTALPPVAALPINACTSHLTKESTVHVHTAMYSTV